MTYNIHEREEVILHVLLAMKANNRVVDPQEDFDVVVVLRCISAATLNGVINLLGQGVKSTRYIQLCFCIGIRRRRWKKMNENENTHTHTRVIYAIILPYI